MIVLVLLSPFPLTEPRNYQLLNWLIQPAICNNKAQWIKVILAFGLSTWVSIIAYNGLSLCTLCALHTQIWHTLLVLTHYALNYWVHFQFLEPNMLNLVIMKHSWFEAWNKESLSGPKKRMDSIGEKKMRFTFLLLAIRTIWSNLAKKKKKNYLK